MFERITTIAKEFLATRHGEPIRIGFGIGDQGTKLHEVVERLGNMIDASKIEIHAYLDNKIEGNTHHSNISIIHFHESENPALAMCTDLKTNHIDGVIRGTMGSSGYLKALKTVFQTDHLYRLALLSTSSGYEFAFAPVGIDEGKTLEEKYEFVQLISQAFGLMGLQPSIYMLSAGRLDDIDRDDNIARSIHEIDDLVQNIKRSHPSIAIKHGQILIEDAPKQGANVIIAPDGITGNLIYRTLIHLGGGISRGAWYLNRSFPGPVIDTSRVGPINEHAGGFILALAKLASMRGHDNSQE